MRDIAIAGVALLLFASLAGVTSAQAATFTDQMDIGATGAQVTALQTYLAGQPALYPEGLITGYYGSLTAAAVGRFQTKYGLPSVGRVGPLTLAKLNEVAGGADISAPVIGSTAVSSGRTGATVHWMTNESASGKVFFSSTPLSYSEAAGPGALPTINGNVGMTDLGLRTVQDVALSGLNPSTTYYYVIQVTDQSGNTSVTWPSTFTTTP